MVVYSSTELTMDATVSYEAASDAGYFSIYAGEKSSAVDTARIHVYGGTYNSIRAGNSDKPVTNCTINIGGNTTITNCIVSGGSFYGGIRVDGTAGGINGVLAEGYGFYENGSLVTVADDITELAGEPVVVQKALWGDANSDGTVDAYDAALVKKYSVGSITADGLNLGVLDLDGDQVVDAYDAALIQKYSIGLITKFPVQVNNNR